MNAKMTSSKLSMFTTSLPPCPLPTDEEFNLFHSIDRELYRKLIIILSREIAESMKVMAFWLWLERQGSRNLVKRMLSFPIDLLNGVANESVLCLKCVEENHFSIQQNAYELALLPKILGKNITLKYFYENRTMVLNGVRKLLDEVCNRAFKDINQNALDAITRTTKAPEEQVRDIGINHRAASSSGVVKTGSVTRNPFEESGSSMANGSGLTTELGLKFAGELQGQVMQQKNQVVNDELNEIFSSKLNLEEEEEEDDAFPKDRTVILTFSRLHPISENEFKDFFTRQFGDFIEEIHMQVQPFSTDEPVLYAKMVARAASIVDAVVKGGIAEYYINGKYVHAQKSITKKKLPSRKN